MFNIENYDKTKDENYALMIEQLKSLSYNVNNSVSVLSNASALLNCFFDNINWVGFYLLDGDVLKVGPFQGIPACTLIPLNKGVCGFCATTQKTQLVGDVHQFEGHIACDMKTNSEIVVPIFKNGILYGVLDIDSPVVNYFDLVDQNNLELFCEELAKFL